MKTKISKKIKSEDIKNLKIYTRDWYYNTGIVGFLNALSAGEKNIDKIKSRFKNKISINDNCIEFNVSLLDNYFETYIKIAFEKFFNLDSYKERINNLINKINKMNNKIPKKLLNDVSLSGKTVNDFIKTINKGKSLEYIFAKNNNKNTILKEIKKIQSIIKKFDSSSDVYKKIKNERFIKDFLESQINKRICNYTNIPDYIKRIKDLKICQKNEHKCFICGKYKKEYDFNNAITQVIGFNSDNSNWIWGFNTSKAKICPLCALVYSSALLGMVFLLKKINKENKTHFYFLNRNTNIPTLYSSFWLFKERISKEENKNKPFYTILQEITVEIINRQASAVLENINFIEIVENQFGGQSTKSYNVYNYNITKELAEFIKTTGKEKIPKGYYKEMDFYSDITEELLKKSLEQSLSFYDLSRYFDYFIRSLQPNSNCIAHFSIQKVNKYILTYINKIKGGNQMTLEQIVNKAFYNGLELGKKIGQENKIKGIAYQLLNDLKIGDKNSFIDKYLRLCMSYGSEVKLGSNNELVDIDNFMSFGYSFVNGLLSNIKQNENKEVNNG